MLTRTTYAIAATALLAGTAGAARPAAPRPPFILSSPAFRTSHKIPRLYTCGGRGISPPLRWTRPPLATRSFALRVFDSDKKGFTHWLAWNIPRRLRALPAAARPPRQGRNGFGRIGYGGPCPPRGSRPHHYAFVLYALRRPLRLRAGARTAGFVARLHRTRVLALATLVGAYRR